jgi:hypothetical protein
MGIRMEDGDFLEEFAASNLVDDEVENGAVAKTEWKMSSHRISTKEKPNSQDQDYRDESEDDRLSKVLEEGNDIRSIPRSRTEVDDTEDLAAAQFDDIRLIAGRGGDCGRSRSSDGGDDRCGLADGRSRFDSRDIHREGFEDDFA